MLDGAALITAAVALVAPYLAKAGESAAEKVGEASAEGAGKVLGWMRAKLTGRAKEALDDLEKAPGSEDNQADLRKQLARAIEADPALAEELRALIPAEAMEEGAMVQNVSGAGAKAAQVRGSGNRTTIG
ncbi:MAG TPA: hypothetical protein VFQ67_00810 [Allosphingosinicella sp.]|nr:hypothetical protein [Allosphingosinicella sp.]